MSGSWSNQVQNQVIVAGANAGIFVYSGAPAFGNLIYSVAAAAGTDGFGNAYLGGSVTYSGGVLAVAVTGTAIQTFSAPGPGGPWSTTGGTLTIFSTSFAVFASAGISLDGGPVSATAGTASAPSLITTDTWHTMTLLNSWTLPNGNYYARYQLMPDGSVWIQGRISGGTATGGTSIWTPPAGYAPTITPNQAVGVTVENTTGAATADSPRLDVSSTGAVLQNVASSTVISFNGRYSLT